MSKVAIVFWSATGNTETMANCIAEGAGAAAAIVPCADMTPAKLGEFDVVAFGCPAMGAEQLEESEFEPMFAGLEGSLNGKKVALFGSYGWGDGQWMRDWCERAKEDGAVLFSEEGLICNETPDDDVLGFHLTVRLRYLLHQLFGPDEPPQQAQVDPQQIRKPLPGAPEIPLPCRFFHRAKLEALDRERDALCTAIQQQNGHPGRQPPGQIVQCLYGAALRREAGMVQQ